MLTASLYTTIADLEQLKSDWQKLYTETSQPSISFEWVFALANNHIKKDDQFFIGEVIVDDNMWKWCITDIHHLVDS